MWRRTFQTCHSLERRINQPLYLLVVRCLACSLQVIHLCHLPTDSLFLILIKRWTLIHQLSSPRLGNTKKPGLCRRRHWGDYFLLLFTKWLFGFTPLDNCSHWLTNQMINTSHWAVDGPQTEGRSWDAFCPEVKYPWVDFKYRLNTSKYGTQDTRDSTCDQLRGWKRNTLTLGFT